MNGILIIIEAIFLTISGIYYMSLMAYKGKQQLHKKKVVIATTILGCSIPGVFTYLAGPCRKRSMDLEYTIALCHF